MKLAIVAALLAAASLASADGAGLPLAHGYRLQIQTIDGCEGLPYAHDARDLWVKGAEAVDSRGHFWMLDRPARYHASAATTHYRVGSGALRVDARLADDFSSETIRISMERPIEAQHLATYLPHVALPCTREIHYGVEHGQAHALDLDALARFDAALHEATELLYDDRFRDAEPLLREAARLRPDSPTPYWMLARLRYLELEARTEELSSEARIQGYEEAERYADEAVARAPHEPEGYLWQAIARGRIVTAHGSLRAALSGMLGGRGPAWLEDTLRRAVALPETFRFFGDSTRGDALYALAQFYRLAPDAWYMSALGARGDVNRSVELLREAVERQPERLEYHKELAIALLCRGDGQDRESARRELRDLLARPAITAIDAIDRQHAERLLSAVPPNICGYSRDGFVEFAP